MHYFILKIPNKIERQQVVYNHSSDISLKDFINLYIKCTGKPNSFLDTDPVLASENPPSFR